MNLASIKALSEKDMDNFLAASTPGGIERQEAQGQRTFCANETLPVEMLHGCTREKLQAMGITFSGNDIEDLFVNVTLPPGWKKVPTAHSMWTDLMDDKGRKRAAIFYKAAFYDRHAHISLVRRFNPSICPTDGWEDPNYRKKEWKALVEDCGKIAWANSETLQPEPDRNEDKEEWLGWNHDKDKLEKSAIAWLDENYPDWRDETMYWD